MSINVRINLNKQLVDLNTKGKYITCILCVQNPAVRCSRPRVRIVAAAKVSGSGLNNEGFIKLAIFVATYPG